MNPSTRLTVYFLSIAVFGGCSTTTTERLGEFSFHTPEQLGIHHRPGTSLRWDGETVWKNVFTGYFHPHDVGPFQRDDMLVFVGTAPWRDIWYPHPQLFVVRGGDTPVLLSEHILSKPFLDPRKGSPKASYSLIDISPTTNGVRAVFHHYPDPQTYSRNPFALLWDEIESYLRLPATSFHSVSHPCGNYRVLRSP